MVFSPSGNDKTLTINFGQWKGLTPVTETKWLGVTLDTKLKFQTHRDNVIAKGKKRASFLSSLSNTRWGIPPRLFKILITSTVHAATDYAIAAWIHLSIPKFFSGKLSSIDMICSKKALGALNNSPHVFLQHDLHLQPPHIWLTARIVSTIALIASRPPSHPLYHFYQHTLKTNTLSHLSPLHAFFQSPTAESFCRFFHIQQPDSAVALPATPNFATLIVPDKDRAIQSIITIKPSNVHTIVYLDGSCIDGKSTAAAAWCQNNKHFSSQQLGRESEYGIFKAEFVGLIHALRLDERSIFPSTR